MNIIEKTAFLLGNYLTYCIITKILQNDDKTTNNIFMITTTIYVSYIILII